MKENETDTTLLEAPQTLPETAKLMNGSHAVIRSLIEEGVETLFGYPGGAIMPVYDAIYDYQDQIDLHLL